MFQVLFSESKKSKKVSKQDDIFILWKTIFYHFTHHIYTSNRLKFTKSTQNFESNNSVSYNNSELKSLNNTNFQNSNVFNLISSENPISANWNSNTSRKAEFASQSSFNEIRNNSFLFSHEKTIFNSDLQFYFEQEPISSEQIRLLECLRFEILNLMKVCSDKNLLIKLQDYHSRIHFILLTKQKNLNLREVLRIWLNSNFQTVDPVVHAMRGNWKELYQLFPEMEEPIQKLKKIHRYIRMQNENEYDLEFNNIDQYEIKSCVDAKEDSLEHDNLTFDQTKYIFINSLISIIFGLANTPQSTGNQKFDILYCKWYQKFSDKIPNEIKHIFLGRNISKKYYWADELCCRLTFFGFDQNDSLFSKNDLFQLRTEENFYTYILTEQYNLVYKESDDFMKIVVVFSALKSHKLLLSNNKPINAIYSIISGVYRSFLHVDTVLCASLALFCEDYEDKIKNIFYDLNGCVSEQFDLIDFCEKNNIVTKNMLKHMFDYFMAQKRYIDAINCLKNYNFDAEINMELVDYCIRSNSQPIINYIEDSKISHDIKRFIKILNSIVHLESLNESIEQSDLDFLLNTKETIFYVSNITSYILKHYSADQNFLIHYLHYISQNKKKIDDKYDTYVAQICSFIQKSSKI